jgi:hypothetical protein
VSHEIGHVLGFGHDDDLAIMEDELDPGIRFLIDEVGFDQDPDLPVSNQALLQLAMQAARLEEAKRIGRDGEAKGGVGFELDGPAATGLASRVDWDSDHSGWSGLMSKDGKVRAGGNFADFLSSVFDDDDTTAKEGEKVDQPAKLDSMFAMKNKADKGWFDL